MIAVYCAVLALFISLALVPLMVRWAVPLGLMDEPGPRKIHGKSIPRVGGIAIAAGTLIAIFVWLPWDERIAGYLFGALVIVVFGVIDDREDLDYRLKFAGQVAAALLFIWISGVHVTRAPFVYGAVIPEWIGLPLTVMVLVGITNAINLADGMDGLAGSTSLITAAALGYFAFVGGDLVVTLVAVCLVSATLGFLRYNTHPARVFMGDTGSQFLGFSVAVLGILVIEQSNTAVSPLVPLLVLALPIIDTFYVMTKRIRAGRSPFSPDREHLHHRLLDGGFSQYEALLVVYVWLTLLVSLAWWLRYAPDAMLVGAFAVFGAGVLYGMDWWLGRQTSGRDIARRLDPFNRLVDRLRASRLLAYVGRYGVVYGLSLLLPFAAITAQHVTPDIGWVALLLTFMMLLALLPMHVLPELMVYRLSAFAVSALVVYLVESEGVIGLPSVHWFHAYLVIMACCVALWFRFAGTGDFRVNALDVLVIALVVTVPNISILSDARIGLMFVETLLLFYACELVLSERPMRWDVFRLSVVGALSVLAVRGIMNVGP